MSINTLLQRLLGKSYIVSGFTDDTALAQQMQGTDKDATQTPYQDNENLFEETQL